MKFVYTVMAILLLFWLYNIIELIRLLYQCPKLASLFILAGGGLLGGLLGGLPALPGLPV